MVDGKNSRKYCGSSHGGKLRLRLLRFMERNNKRLCFHATAGQYWSKRDFARANRSKQTKAEEALWKRIRKHQVKGQRFRRQHMIGRYIVDFVCLEQKLIIEADGEYHAEATQQEKDAERQQELENAGFHVLRFTNEQVLQDIESVLAIIRAHLDS